MQKLAQSIQKIFKKQNPKQEGQTDNKDDYVYLPSQAEILNFLFKNFQVGIFWINLLAILSLLITYIDSLSTQLLIQLKQIISQNNNNDEKWNYFFFYLTAKFSKDIFAIIENLYLYRKFQLKNQKKIQSKTVKHALTLDIHYFEENKCVEMVQIITNGVFQLQNYIQNSQQISILARYFKDVCVIYLFFKLNFKMALISHIVIFLLFYKNLQFKKQISLLEKGNSKLKTFQSFQVRDLLVNIVTIKQFGTEKKEIQNMNRMIQQKLNSSQNINSFVNSQSMFLIQKSMLLKMSIFLQLLIISKTSVDSNLEILFAFSEIQSFYQSIEYFYDQIYQLIQKSDYNYFTEQVKDIGKLMKLFEQKSLLSETIIKFDEQLNLSQGISFKNVYFSYPLSNDKLAKMNQQFYESNKSSTNQSLTLQKNAQENYTLAQSNLNDESEIFLESEQIQNKVTKNTLENVSFEIQKGQYVSFVGKSGSGKSTITKLLLRLYDPNSGSVFFDDKNAKNIAIKQIKQSIGYVSQDPTLLDNDILYNITYGCEEYSEEDLLKVCDYSGVSEFAFDKKRFPEGLKTLIGANGSKLSGGQKQRIAIARALLKKPSILILDEATSSLDAESEHTVQKYIDQLIESQKHSLTIIVIAHRLSTVVKSDKIFVMEKGQLKEEGTHEELIQKNNIYKKLVMHQISKHIEE